MADPDDSTLNALTTDIVAAYLAHNHVPAAEIPALIVSVHGALVDLSRGPEAEVAPAKPVPPLPIRKTLRIDYIVSLEDGRPYKTLKRHLGKLGMTPAEYRAKWGLPHDYPMVCAAYSAARSALAKEMGLGAMRRKR